MEKLLNFVEEEWAVVSQAPMTFVVLAALMFGISYLWHRERIKKLTEQKQLRDDDIARLKEKTGSDDLAGVIDRITAVEGELRELGETDFVAVWNGEKKISDLPELP